MKVAVAEILDEVLYRVGRAWRLIPVPARPRVAPVPLSFEHVHDRTARDMGEYYLHTVTGR